MACLLRKCGEKAVRRLIELVEDKECLHRNLPKKASDLCGDARDQWFDVFQILHCENPNATEELAYKAWRNMWHGFMQRTGAKWEKGGQLNFLSRARLDYRAKKFDKFARGFTPMARLKVREALREDEEIATKRSRPSTTEEVDVVGDDDAHFALPQMGHYGQPPPHFRARSTSTQVKMEPSKMPFACPPGPRRLSPEEMKAEPIESLVENILFAMGQLSGDFNRGMHYLQMQLDELRQRLSAPQQ
ncbi:hypothetical protein QR680_009818 [Steinernema hermaphroditum]|uniref:Uncharacterized protein n=1 Tax=Steinernema hermaphroditum TaxID=289476 RepID=A0AA39IP64_9BILA|nr:hypothetical protein QR680_009818 [Steinernema hermaphroditum]